MKKIYLTLALISLIALGTNAQDNKKYTIKAGAGMSNIVGSDTDGDMRFSYKLGITYDVEIAKDFYIMPGIEFIAKGFEDTNMTYLQVPVQAAYRFNINNNTNLELKAGPYIAYGLYGGDIKLLGGKIDVFSDNGLERLDAGIAAGVSLNICRFVIGLEYSRGLLKLDDSSSMYNQAFGITAGYKF